MILGTGEKVLRVLRDNTDTAWCYSSDLVLRIVPHTARMWKVADLSGTRAARTRDTTERVLDAKMVRHPPRLR